MRSWLKLSMGALAFATAFAAIAGIVVGVLVWDGPLLARVIVAIVGALALVALVEGAADALRAWRVQRRSGEEGQEDDAHLNLQAPDSELRGRHFRTLAPFLRSPFTRQVNRIRHHP